MNITFKTIAVLFIFFSLTFQIASGQSFTAQIIDSQNKKPISFATILVNKSETLISNAEGFFTISENINKNNKALTISYIGYATQNITIEDLLNQNNIIKLEEGIINLDEVKISNKKLTPYEIMVNVKANLKRNYNMPLQPIKHKLFLRETSNFKPLQLDIEITKSSGFSKEALNQINSEISSFTKYLFSNPLKEYNDLLCNFYNSYTKKDDKMVRQSKLDVLKAVKIKNENSASSLDDLEIKAKKIFLVHLDSTKYYRIKSGVFSSSDTISLSKEYNNKKNREKKAQITSTKSKLNSFFVENSLLNKHLFKFIHNIEDYDYNLEKTIYNNDNEFVYVLGFSPKKSKAKYSGKLYISETDFAVIRVDYDLEKGKKVNSINVKFLLGIKASQNISNGTLLFKKNIFDSAYYLHYASREEGQYFYVNRPLKFIEITKQDKDIVAFDLKIEANTIEKKEYLNIEQTEVSQASLEKISESDFKFIRMNSYDPKIWKNYSAIEPLQEMKQFKTVN